MNAGDLRAVLLWRAIEPATAARATGAGATAEPSAAASPVPPADPVDPIDWAGAEARQRLGEHAAPEAWLAERARLRVARLAEQQPAWRPVLDAASLSTGWGWPAGLLAAAALLGAVGEQLGASRFIHLLAPPLLGLLAWNLAVYAVLGLQALRQRPAAPPAAAGAGALRRSLLGLAARGRAQAARVGSALDAPRAAAFARFQRDWLSLSAPWQAARGVALLHAAAAALALGALASWYARGLVLDYQAGWDSTFLNAGQVRRLLGWVLGPAAALTGQPLPDAATLATLRGAEGGSERADRWIHLWSLTVLGAVVLPRAALATAAAWRAHRLARQLPLPDDDGLRRLLRAASGQRLTLAVLPYSYQLDAVREAALLQQVDRLWGPGVLPRLCASLPMGAEDDLPRQLADAMAAARPTAPPTAPPATVSPHPPADRPTGRPPDLPARVVVLFALTATPERETHGALLRALAAVRGADAPPLDVLVDESGFRQRLAGATLAERLAQRRAAWQALLQPFALAPQFIDLGSPTAAASPTAA